MNQTDWIAALKRRLKRNRKLATALFYLTDLAYLNLAERRRFLRSFWPGARLVNLGAGFRNSPPGFLAFDRETYAGIDVVGDLSALPFPEQSLDGILCEMVLEHVADAAGALREIRRVLRPGGRVYLALPFLWPYHAAPHDYWRFTTSGIETSIAGLETVAIGLSGGPTTTLCLVLHEWLAIVLSFNIEILYRALYIGLIPLIYPFRLLDHLVHRYRQANRIGALFYVHARKPGPPT